jgi:hypothetical protein
MIESLAKLSELADHLENPEDFLLIKLKSHHSEDPSSIVYELEQLGFKLLSSTERKNIYSAKEPKFQCFDRKTFTYWFYYPENNTILVEWESGDFAFKPQINNPA